MGPCFLLLILTRGVPAGKVSSVARDRIIKHALICFGLAAVVYAVVFTFVEGRRTRLGPWVVTFHDQSGTVNAVRIDQSALGLTNITILLAASPAEGRSTNHMITFDQPQSVPFVVPGGQCVFLDLLFQPGTVVLEVEEHQIQMLPRTLAIDGKEVAWLANSVHDLRPQDE